jgi:energy-converting hydrogenase Eha subunit E
MSTLFLFLVKELGGATLAFSLMLYLAYRDPVRNVAIINAVIVGLCILAFTPLLSLYTLDIRAVYPASLVLVRTLVRLVLAALLFYLRPRQAPVAQG